MRTLCIAIAPGLLLAAPAHAQQATLHHPISAENSWHIDDHNCTIDAGWDEITGVMISRHDDHHDLQMVSDGKNFPGVRHEKVIDVAFAANGAAIEARAYQAIGYSDGKVKSYVSDVDDALLDAVAEANSLQFSRGGKLLLDLNMTGFGEALAAMRACEAAQPVVEPGTVEDAAAAAAEAAADAAAVDGLR